jgi:hypothetical protein
MNITGNTTNNQAQFIRVKGADNEAAEIKLGTQEIKEEPKQAPAMTDARSGASPAVYA